MKTMKALVKKKAEPGLWLEEVPVPTIGINDVLIKVLRTGICGTDVHIYNWDAWAQKTIPVPMVVGHEFVGRIVEVGSQRQRLPRRRDRQRRGARRLRPLPQLPGRPAAPVQGHQGHRRQPPRRVRRVPGAADDQRLGPRPEHRRATCRRSSTRSATRCTRRCQFDVLGEDVLITGAGPIGMHGRRGRPPRRGAARRRHRRQSVPPRAGQARWARRCAVDVRSETLADVQKQLGMKEGFDVGLEMSRQPRRLPRHARQHVPTAARSPCSASPTQRDGHRLEHRHLQHAHDQGHLRPRDVRDLVQDDRHAPDRAWTSARSSRTASPITEFEKGFDAMRSGKSGKVILKWREG